MTGGFIVFWEVVGYCLFRVGQRGGLAMSYGMWYLSSPTTIKPMPPALEVQSLNHQTTGDVPWFFFKDSWCWNSLVLKQGFELWASGNAGQMWQKVEQSEVPRFHPDTNALIGLWEPLPVLVSLSWKCKLEKRKGDPVTCRVGVVSFSLSQVVPRGNIVMTHRSWCTPNSFSCCVFFVLGCFSPVQLFASPRTVACQSPVSTDFSGRSTRVGCHLPLQGILPTQGSNLHLLIAGGFFTTESQGKPHFLGTLCSENKLFCQQMFPYPNRFAPRGVLVHQRCRSWGLWSCGHVGVASLAEPALLSHMPFISPDHNPSRSPIDIELSPSPLSLRSPPAQAC